LRIVADAGGTLLAVSGEGDFKERAMAPEDQPPNNTTIPAVYRKLFGKPPIIASEDPAVYQQLMELVIAEFEPKAASEWLLAKDVTDAEWELLRLKGFKVGMINLRLRTRLKSGIENPKNWTPKNPCPDSSELLERLMAGDLQAQAIFKQIAPHVNVEENVVDIFERNIDSQLNADRLVDAAVRRRNAAYAEFDRLRSNKPARQRHIADAPTLQPADVPSGNRTDVAAPTADDMPTDAPRTK
jgi:hypothetical protein